MTVADDDTLIDAIILLTLKVTDDKILANTSTKILLIIITILKILI